MLWLAAIQAKTPALGLVLSDADCRSREDLRACWSAVSLSTAACRLSLSCSHC